MKKYFFLWLILSKNSFLVSLTSGFSAVLFLIGKIFRFALLFIFLFSLLAKTRLVAGYTMDQIIFFFLTYTVIDTITQLFFREVYRFRPLILSGDFDLVLTKPMSPLFRSLAGGADPLDFLMLIPYTTLLAIYMGRISQHDPWFTFLFFLLLGNSLLIATGFHIIVLSLTVFTTEMDHTIMIYRDLASTGRVPVDIYREPLRSILTFVVPVGIMMTIPAKAFMGLMTWQGSAVFIGIGITFFLFCLFVWRLSLRSYASASS